MVNDITYMHKHAYRQYHGLLPEVTRVLVLFLGIDCSIEATRGHWESMGKVSSDGQASHSAVVVGQYMWTVGGYTFNEVLLNLTR